MSEADDKYRKCPFCSKIADANENVVLSNYDIKCFEYMDYNCSSHFDCYIKEVIKDILREKA